MNDSSNHVAAGCRKIPKTFNMKMNQNLFGSFLELAVFQVLPKEPRDISSVMLTIEGSSLKKISYKYNMKSDINIQVCA